MNFFKLLFAFIFATYWLSSCNSDSEQEIPNYSCNEPVLIANKSISEIKNSATKNPTLYVPADIIEAYVISSDKEGNFYKSITLQSKDKSVGFSVAVDDTNLYLNYSPGRKVYVQLRNTYTDLYYGGLRIGSLYVYPESKSATIGRLSLFDYPTILTRSCEVIPEKGLNSVRSIASLSDQQLNTLITIENVQFTTESHGRTLYESTLDIGGATNHLIQDQTGKKLIFRISSYANFSSEAVPTNKGTVTGILTKYKDDYQLMPRYYRDIQF